MRNGTFIDTIIKMQFVPRWGEFAPHFEDTAASHSFRSAAIAILVGIIEDKYYGNQVDKLGLLGKALWSNLKNTGTGSIKHVTKKENLVAEFIRAYENEISKNITLLLSKSIQPFAYAYIVNTKDDSYVGKLVDAIDTLDAFLFCHRESQYGTNPYFHAKSVELRESLLACNLPSITWIIHEFDKQEGVYDFIGYLVNLDTVKRWNGNYNLVPDNDATHSFRVASLALFNGLIEREKFNKTNIDLYKLVGKAILHDTPEAIGGDTGQTLKISNSETKKAFESYEKDIARSMIEKLPLPFHDELTELMVESKSDDYEGQMVDIADKLDALLKANMEMRNNPYYAETYYNQLKKIQHTYENPSVIFFLAYILHDLTYSNLR
jgi:putative hydrolase of HD superfamily